MAENSVRTKENPFSFKNFLKNNVDGETSPIRRKKKDDGSEDDDNPFSFRKFLHQGKSPEIKHSQCPSANVSILSSAGNGSSNSFLPLRIPESSVDSDSNFSQELPDFIQDHLEQANDSNSKDNSQSSLNSMRNSLDQTYCCEDLYSSSLNNNHLESSVVSFAEICASESYEGSYEDESRCRLIDDTTSSLPDFISTTLHHDTLVTPPCSFDDSLNSTQSKASFSEEVCMLREENVQLHKQLEEASDNAEQQLARIAGLEDKLSELSDKETQETVALEKMVQQVELNLQVTTERAVKAEMQVSKLKQEMKSLQIQLKSMAKENQKLSSAHSLMDRDTIAERADSIALQIKTAADNAEQPLRTMMEGLEQLRFLSSLVADIGKIQEAD